MRPMMQIQRMSDGPSEDVREGGREEICYIDPPHIS